MSAITAEECGSKNICAFLDMISHSEGTDRYGTHEGYDVMVGGTLFAGFSDHPHKVVQLNSTLSSTAAGRYQLLARYFDAYKKQLALRDFSPLSQDLIAIQQMRERHALPMIVAGQFDQAVDAVRNIWASLPGAGYGQHENDLGSLRQKYLDCGGKLDCGPVKHFPDAPLLPPESTPEPEPKASFIGVVIGFLFSLVKK